MSTTTIKPYHELRSEYIADRQRCRNHRDYYRAKGDAEWAERWQKYMDGWGDCLAAVNATRMKVLAAGLGR